MSTRLEAILANEGERLLENLKDQEFVRDSQKREQEHLDKLVQQEREIVDTIARLRVLVGEASEG